MPLICKRVFRQIFCLKTLFLFMGLFEQVQVEIEKRCLSGGGWASGNGRRAGIEITCYALMALHARHALELLGDRVDELGEIGNAQIVLGRALMEQDRLDEAEVALAAGERAYDQFSSGSHRASAWVAQGDLAMRRGDDRTAARLYRQAADALQDVRF